MDDPDGPALLAKFRAGEVKGIVFPEVSKEIYDIGDEKTKRREKLKTILRLFFPVEPTYVPLADLARAGACRPAPPGAVGLREDLKSVGFRKLDIVHLMNAHYSKCELFITRDERDILKRTMLLEAKLRIRILRPDELLKELDRAL